MKHRVSLGLAVLMLASCAQTSPTPSLTVIAQKVTVPAATIIVIDENTHSDIATITVHPTFALGASGGVWTAPVRTDSGSGSDSRSRVTVLFGIDRAAIKNADKQRIAQLVKTNGPSAQYQIQGRADSTGAARYNQALSARRANAVRASLIALGVPASHIDIHALGEGSPIASNATAFGRARNRSAQTTVIEIEETTR